MVISYLGIRIIMNWNKLSMLQKAGYIRLGVANGITNLNHIINTYNSYAEGGGLDSIPEGTSIAFPEKGHLPIVQDNETGSLYYINDTNMIGIKDLAEGERVYQQALEEARFKHDTGELNSNMARDAEVRDRRVSDLRGRVDAYNKGTNSNFIVTNDGDINIDGRLYPDSKEAWDAMAESVRQRTIARNTEIFDRIDDKVDRATEKRRAAEASAAKTFDDLKRITDALEREAESPSNVDIQGWNSNREQARKNVLNTMLLPNRDVLSLAFDAATMFTPQSKVTNALSLGMNLYGIAGDIIEGNTGQAITTGIGTALQAISPLLKFNVTRNVPNSYRTVTRTTNYDFTVPSYFTGKGFTMGSDALGIIQGGFTTPISPWFNIPDDEKEK